jgi:SAM-dependent methyltransferase
MRMRLRERLARLAERAGVTRDFYTDTIRKAMKAGVLRPHMRVLVVCGGERDREVLLRCGLEDVTISNLDTRMRGDEFSPCRWSFQDAENLSFENDAFDFSIAHSGLHHCSSPHRALCEMYRVSKVGLLVFEPHDGALVRLGVRMNIGQEYEVASVFDNDMIFGGVRNSHIPNYVYRWTEDEVKKTVHSYAPVGRHSFSFFYTVVVPWERFKRLRNKLYLCVVIMSVPLVKAVELLLPRLCNHFAFLVLKPKLPDDLFPWLRLSDERITVNEEWLTTRYTRA